MALLAAVSSGHPWFEALCFKKKKKKNQRLVLLANENWVLKLLGTPVVKSLSPWLQTNASTLFKVKCGGDLIF